MFTSMVLASIQALRFSAALLVLFFHMSLLKSGFKGVDLFFVISGFVLSYTYYSRPSTIRTQRRRYFIHRLTKIYLLYWTVLILRCILKPFPLDLPLIESILLLPGHNPVLSISWSLSCELYYYTLLGITFFYIPVRWHKGLFVTAFLLTAAVKLCNTWFINLQGTPLYFLAGPNLWEFLCGVLTGFIVCRLALPGRSPDGRKIPYIAFALLLLILFGLLPVLHNNPYYHFIYAPIAMLLVMTAVLAEKKNPWQGAVKDWAIRLGNASYAIYLFAPIVHILVPTTTLIWNLAAMLILIILGLIVNHFYEEKALKIIRDLAERLLPTGHRPVIAKKPL